MEFEQLIKRLDWLDEEHRKDKAAVEAMSERLAKTEGDLKAANKQIKGLTTQLSELTTTAARLEQYDTALAQQRTDLSKYVDELDKKNLEHEKDVDKRYQVQFSGLTKSILELQKNKELIAELKRENKAHADEETRRKKDLAEWETRISASIKTIEDVLRSQKVADEARRQDAKRLAALQGEISAARKRVDEVREKNDLNTDGYRRLEARLNELLLSETERRQAQTTFIETQARLQIDRDHVWKEWEESLQTNKKQVELMDHHLQDWDSAQRSVKHAQEVYEDIVQKFERRINEITEMQRLAEDRFRQEWVTFKADDQKRWTSFSLSQDESHKDSRTSVVKLDERLTIIEDLTQTLQDVIGQTKDANEQLFQGMLAQIHELLSAYERIMSTK